MCRWVIFFLWWTTHINTLLLRMQGKSTEAEALYEKSQAIREKVLGPEHPDVATLLMKRAGLLIAQVRAVSKYQDRSLGVPVDIVLRAEL